MVSWENGWYGRNVPDSFIFVFNAKILLRSLIYVAHLYIFVHLMRHKANIEGQRVFKWGAILV